MYMSEMILTERVLHEVNFYSSTFQQLSEWIIQTVAAADRLETSVFIYFYM